MSKLKCTVCGREYDACPTCLKVKSYSAWRNIACSEEHYKIFNIVSYYAHGDITKEVAKEKLSGIDISGHESWNTISGKLLTEISAEPVKVLAETEEITQEEVTDKKTAAPKKSIKRQSALTSN